MKLHTIVSVVIFGLSASAPWSAIAARTGVDERIHICQTDATAQVFGANQKFRLHIVAGDSFKMTRISDKKVLQAQFNGTVYVYKTTGSAQEIVSSKWGGYLFDVNQAGELTIAVGEGPGSYSNERLTCKLVRQISQLDPLSATEEALVDIGNNANLANGSFETEKFDLNSFDLKTEQAKLDRERKGWPGCKWRRFTDQAKVLELIEKEADDLDAVQKLKAIEKKPGLFTMIGLASDNDISCSQRYVWVYTSDGYKLSLMYSQGD